MNKEKQMNITTAVLGTLQDGQEVSLYRIEGPGGTYLELSDLGARMTQAGILDKDGQVGPVLQDFDKVELWAGPGKNHGATCGRFANRIGGAAFVLNGERFVLNANEKGNTLHGGLEGFNAKVWSGEILDDAVRFTYVSLDGEEGFPGELTATVEYRFDGQKVEILEMASSTKDTVIGLCNHAYFQIGGPKLHASILDHELTVEADQYTVVDEALIPTGELRPVAGTAFDFRSKKAIGQDIEACDEQIHFGGGYDHNFVLRKEERGNLELASTLHDPNSGRTLRCYTTKPGLQIYTGNADIVDEDGKLLYKKHGAICMETQGFPHSTGMTHFPSPVLRQGETYKETTVYEFTV